MTGADLILTPWHHVVVGDRSRAALRLAAENPTVLRVLEDHGDTWEAALAALITDGATDDEIRAGGWVELLPSIPLQRHLTDTLARLRGDVPGHRDAPTELALLKVPVITRLYHQNKRNTRRLPSRKTIAGLAGVDRGTMAGWIARGWMSWPPD